jgi:hypothetical protein
MSAIGTTLPRWPTASGSAYWGAADTWVSPTALRRAEGCPPRSSRLAAVLGGTRLRRDDQSEKSSDPDRRATLAGGAAFKRSKMSMSGRISVGGFEEGEFEGDSPTEEVAAHIGLRGADAVQLPAQEIDEAAKIRIVVQRDPLGVHEIVR